ncbi:MAG: NTP transferase domain-containing protein [bacterium]
MNANSIPYVSAILLAAGMSKRMHLGNKLLLNIKGKSVLRWCVENVLKSAASEIVVVAGKDFPEIKSELNELEVSILRNKNYFLGMSTSIMTGIKALNVNSEGALILLADQPLLSTNTINRFLETFQKRGKKIIAAHFKQFIGNPVLFHRSLFPDLLKLKGDVGARSILKHYPEQIATIEIPEVESFDIDTPVDFEKTKYLLDIVTKIP